jgi:hypothetical protein
MVLAAEPVTRGYCLNNPQHLAHRAIGVQLCWSNLKHTSVTCVPTYGISANAYLVGTCWRQCEALGGPESRLHLARNTELLGLDRFGR